MSRKSHFSQAQREIIRATARKLWKSKFEWMKKVKKTKTHPGHPGGQEAMALALGVSQQTVSSLIDPKGAYNPGFTVATAVANLAGMTLDQLIGDHEEPDEEEDEKQPVVVSALVVPSPMNSFKNLDVCIEFMSSKKHWSQWTVAAARAGFFGNADFDAPEWINKLDMLEKVLDKARRAT